MTRLAGLLVALALTGCATSRHQLEDALQRGGPPPTVAGYRLGCGDLVQVSAPGLAGSGEVRAIDPEGRVPLGTGEPRLAGQTTEEARQAVAQLLNVQPHLVRVGVTEHRGAKIFLAYGAEVHALDYRGPEKASALVKRAGTHEAGAADLRELTVVRPNLASGGKPETFTVDLAAVLLSGDTRTDVTLAPGDRVYIAASRRAKLLPVVPQLLRPAYCVACGMEPPGSKKEK